MLSALKSGKYRSNMSKYRAKEARQKLCKNFTKIDISGRLGYLSPCKMGQQGSFRAKYHSEVGQAEIYQKLDPGQKLLKNGAA